MNKNLYINPKVSVKALNEFFSNFKVDSEEVHAIQVFHKDEMLLSIAPYPYSIEDKREIYSLSKSFTSTAIGILWDEGKLSLDDRIIDLFPECVPENISENLAKMKLRHVLSMNTGHENCVMKKMIGEENAVAGFLKEEVKYEPGTHFTYNTGATCLLSCLVEKITGMTLLDFLYVKLFKYLDIEDAVWNKVRSGQNEGGCGLHVSVEDIGKLGRLYLNKGVYNGIRLLSAEWVEMATSFVSDNSDNGTPNWTAGYGYQFWRNRAEGYRGDGAFGQLCVVLPEREMVFALVTELSNMHNEVEAVIKLAHNIFNHDGKEEIKLPDYSCSESKKSLTGHENTEYILDKNKSGFSLLKLSYDEDKNIMNILLSDGRNLQTIKAGRGFFVENRITAPYFKPKILGLMPTLNNEESRFVCYYFINESDKMVCGIRFLNCPHRASFLFEFSDDGVVMNYYCPGLLEYDAFPLRGKKINY